MKSVKPGLGVSGTVRDILGDIACEREVRLKLQGILQFGEEGWNGFGDEVGKDDVDLGVSGGNKPEGGACGLSLC